MTKLKKVAIITLDGYFNFGNRLQNFALQETIRSFGFEVDTLIIPRKESHPNHKKKDLSGKILKIAHKIAKTDLLYFENAINFFLNRDQYALRSKLFKNFSLKYLNERSVEYEANSFSEIDNYYDFFIVGSDQVWNPDFITHAEDAFFLNFAKKAKKIAYAASFGITEIPNSFKELISPWLAKIDHISVREEEAVRILDDISGIIPEVVLDPTLLLSKERWQNTLTSKPKEENYLLMYFLGNKPREATKLIHKASSDFGYTVVDLLDRDHIATVGPFEFISYIKSAKAVFTDSFHGMVFSILLNTPFASYERIGCKSMYSRIKTLKDKLKIEHHAPATVTSINELVKSNTEHYCNYLAIERKKSLSFLKKALFEE